MAGWLVLALSLGGCVVRTYQPMSGLHRPVVVDPTLPNFADVSLDVHCIPGELLSGQEASKLCARVGRLFENQGAAVRTHVSEGREDTGFEEPEADGDAAGPRTELSMVLRSRQTHASNDALSWAFCFASFTLVPAITERSFAQEVVIRDGSGFLLVRDTLEGRLVRRFGFGPWVGNAIADLWRDEEDKLSGERAAQELSEDLYSQLSQRVFDASLHARVLQEASP